MDEHVITTEWVPFAPDEIAYHDYVEGTYNTFSCTCHQPLADRDAATRHAAEWGRCMMCLGSGTISINPHASSGCDSCAGSGRSEPGTVMVQARVTASFVREVAALLPAEFGLCDVVTVLLDRLPPARDRGAEALLSVAAGLIRYLEVQGEVVLCSVPDYVPGDGAEQRHHDPRWIRVS
ncbi:hypothetical protein HCN51_30290 [Nonomuraea sp. FMUSA5-5]|uniref:Uncharacterized protein n=1 Tax=Nonomuraea composti TaxID=2720023 RepID=A0ABX1BAY4_9ACTN|nr:hypothetical protein [Nonomuraea sp. FMUSA5-5]NJP93682.1 hypothetical protein [Nonomuraea sp. FMUSA5-5]